MTHQPPTTADEIAAQLRLFIRPGDVTELRALHVGAPGRTFAGWFDHDHLHDLARNALALTRQAAGVFFIPNPVSPDLLHRHASTTNNVTNVVRRGGSLSPELTKDTDVTERRYLLIDIDPVRFPSRSDRRAGEERVTQIMQQKVPSNFYELAFARRTAFEFIRPALAREGFAPPVIACSGNGFHMIYRLSVPLANFANSPSRDPLAVKLRNLASRFDCDGVKIDVNTYTAARMLKVPGTWARKGEASTLRPHRLTGFTEVPHGWHAAANTVASSAATARDGGLGEYVPEFLADDAARPATAIAAKSPAC
jgi:hypothetical protein